MALVNFSTLNPELATHVVGCPSAVITQYVKKVCIDLCERAKVWRVQLTPQVLTALDHEYAFVSPVAGTEVTTILSAFVSTASGGKTPLDLVTMEQVNAYSPTWPDTDAAGTPLALVRMGPAEYNVVPVPDALDTYTVSMFAAIRPTQTATQIEESILYDFRRVIFHGVLHELMALPKRGWTDDKLALYHGKQWEYFLYSARARTNKGFGRTDINVIARPWA